jgi:G:T-mismatch repair DNA endonuclease (very short patch repair protein)
MDVHDKATRSYNRCRIKGKNTKPEMLVRKFLFANGFRYRLKVILKKQSKFVGDILKIKKSPIRQRNENTTIGGGSRQTDR